MSGDKLQQVGNSWQVKVKSAKTVVMSYRPGRKEHKFPNLKISFFGFTSSCAKDKIFSTRKNTAWNPGSQT